MTSQLNNLTSVNQDATASYFNNFYKPNFTVSQNVDEAIIGFFERVAANKTAAKAMAGSVIYTAMAQHLDPMDTMQQFAALPPLQLNNYLAMFLNLNRAGTSLLGISNAPKPSVYITRSIIA